MIQRDSFITIPISKDPFKPQSNKEILALTQQQKKPQQDDDKEVRKKFLSDIFRTLLTFEESLRS